MTGFYSVLTTITKLLMAFYITLKYLRIRIWQRDVECWGIKALGIHFALNMKNFVGRFTLVNSINVSVNRNKVIQLGANNTPIGGIYQYGDTWKTEVGGPMGRFWGYV